MDLNATKYIIEAALLAANASLSFDRLAELLAARGVEVDRSALKSALSALADDYAEREIELKETASGYRIQVKSSAREWLQPLFEERAPRYTRALLETLALVAYRQPITRAEIEEVRGVAVSSNIVRTLMERGWVRVVGHREVPGRPSMLGTTKEFLDYFGLKKLDDLPALAEVRELAPENDPQSDFVDELAAVLAESAEIPPDENTQDESDPAANVVPIHQSEG
jgi:segregation and condensation protein B